MLCRSGAESEIRERLEEVLRTRLEAAVRSAVAEQIALSGSIDPEQIADAVKPQAA